MPLRMKLYLVVWNEQSTDQMNFHKPYFTLSLERIETSSDQNRYLEDRDLEGCTTHNK